MSNLSKGQKTQQKIIQNAIRLFAKHGFDTASAQMIADESGVSQSSIFQHFGSKKALLEAVRKYVSQSNHQFVDGRIEVRHNALESLKEHFYGNIEWALQSRAEAQIIVLTYYFGCFDKDFLSAAKQAVSLGEERLLKYVLSGQREKLFHFEGPAETVAAALHDSLLGLCVKALAASREKKLDKAWKSRCDLVVASLLQSKVAGK